MPLARAGSPSIAIVGRPNVGKSTLFNRLTRSRDALVADHPGLTRDRQLGFGRAGSRRYLVVDTGGLHGEGGALAAAVARQTGRAIAECDACIFLVDAREGLTSGDQAIASELRTAGKPVYLAINKCEGLDADQAVAEFSELGIAHPVAISAEHGDGVAALIELILGRFEAQDAPADDDRALRINVAIVGRPNVGKSTLVNRIFGEQRVLTSELPGTTRDSIAVAFDRDGQRYCLVDTAGIRRRSRVTDVVEKFSIIKALQAIDRAEVVIAVLDATETVTDQDASLLGLVVDSGRSLIVAVNKWDNLPAEQRERVRRDLERKLRFVDFASTHFISALHGSGVGELFPAIDAAWASAYVEVPTAALTTMLHEIAEANPPPLLGGRRVRLRYAHMGGHNPPRIIVHGTRTDLIPGPYLRYLERAFRERLGLHGTPVRIEFRQGDNPFRGKTNPLRPRAAKKRKRMLDHRRRRERR
jgi:GTP-binding protein